MSKNKIEKYLTPKEVSEILMISPTTVRQWAHKGKLKAYITPGGHRRFKQKDIDEFIQQNKIILPKNDLLKILIIDDDRQTLKFLSLLFAQLKNDNIQVETADNGFDGGMKVQTFNPDVLLLDLRMKEIDGFEICRKVKNDPKTTNIQIICMTGFISEDVENKVLAYGAEHCLSKPIDVNNLLSILDLNYNQSP